MPRRGSALLALVFAAAGFAATGSGQSSSAKPNPRATPELPSPAVLEGVVRSPDGKPIEGALVIARSESARRAEQPSATRTDAQGTFRFAPRGFPPFRVRIEARGLAARSLEKVRPGARLVVSLTKGGAIEGTVRDAATGAPVPGARVEARAADWREPPLAWDPEAGVVSTTSDAKGGFRLEGLGAGLQSVSATARGFGLAQKGSVRVGARVDLVLVRGGSIFGTIFSSDGRPVSGTVVFAEPESSPWSSAPPVRSDAQGGFEVLGLDAGSYTLYARHKDLGLGLVRAVSVERESAASVDIMLSRGAHVAGRLVDPSGNPIVGRALVQELDGRHVPPALTEILAAEAGKDGRFHIDGVPAGFHALAARASTLAPARVEFEVRDRELRVDVGDVNLEPGLAIRGRLRDTAGAGIAGASLWANRFRASGHAEATSEADGSFTLAGLEPGTYRVLVRASGYGPKMFEADVGSHDMDVVMELAGLITGLVVDEGGRPVEAYHVFARPHDAHGTFYQTKSVTSDDGRFSVEAGSGEFALEVQAPEYANAVVSGVNVTSGATTDIGRVRLRRGGVVRGLVVASDGQPVGGATVTVTGPDESTSVLDGVQGTSDATGAFEVRGVPIGLARAMAQHPEYAPGFVDSLEVDPAKGPTEARIVVSRGGTVEGWARKRDGSALPGAYVEIIPEDERVSQYESFSVPGSPDGSFRLDRVAPGPAMIMLMARSGGRSTSIKEQGIEVREGEVTHVELLIREILVSGRVTRSGEPAAGLRVRLGVVGSSSGGISMGSSPVSSIPPGPQRLTAMTREDGGYELLVDGPGTHRVVIETPDGKTSFPSGSVEIPDVEAHTLDIDLKGVPVVGVVVDLDTQQPVGEAHVRAILATREQTGGAWLATGSDGQFRFELEPGEYELSAQAKGYVASRITLSVRTEGTADLKIELKRGMTLEGKVVGSNGRGIGGVSVTAHGGGDGPSGDRDHAYTQPDGSFELTRLQDHAYAILAASETAGYAFRASVTPAERDMILRLGPGGHVRVDVNSPDGSPAVGVWVRMEALNGIQVSAPISRATDAQGAADLPVPAGSVGLVVSKDNLEGRGSVNVVEGGSTSVEVTLAQRP